MAVISQGIIFAAGELGAPALERIAGLSVIRRCLLSLGSAGVERVYIVGADEAVQGIVLADRDYERKGVVVECVNTLDAVADHIDGPAIVTAAQVIFDPGFVRVLAATEVAAGESVAFAADGASTGVYAVSADRVMKLAAEDEPARYPESLGDGTETRVVDVGAAFWHRVTSSDERKRAAYALALTVRKSGDGPGSKYIARPISMRITRVLVELPVTPNHVTLFGSLIGFVGLFLVLRGTYEGLVLGLGLLGVQVILDHCDGEIARLKFKHSRFGQWLDHIADDVSTTSFGMAVGWICIDIYDTEVYWWLAVAGGIGFVIYDLVLAVQLTLVHKSGSPFDFRWWFQKDDVGYVKEQFASGGFGAQVVEFLHATARRDFFGLAWVWLALAELPQVISVWFFIIAAGHGVVSLLHALMGGIGQARRDESK